MDRWKILKGLKGVTVQKLRVACIEPDLQNQNRNTDLRQVERGFHCLLCTARSPSQIFTIHRYSVWSITQPKTPSSRKISLGAGSSDSSGESESLSR